MDQPNQTEGRMGIMVVVEFDKGLLSHFTVPEWNAFVADLTSRGFLPPMWEAGQPPPPISVLLAFKGLRRAHYRLDGINLSMATLDRADFSYASLKNAILGCGKGVIYRGARVHGADFRMMDISGCDFTGCLGIEEALFEGATHDPGNPPIGLPGAILNLCTAVPEPEPAQLPPSAGSPVQFYTESPLRVCVTIQRVPME